ncbi:hypothetical protein QL919_10780 [Psychrobacter sp. APC 3426]|uniref:hypothetical protein n=1 Tax=Psychrobacter sp. APC 3426 TaxID=3035177 RepID=UPI0025B53AF6|nr:hypothetical protein [Psychrobacter sp. APC 3426]MDN3399209.1 hypothetical protein [Psychrobacter sp. APC 3426]
MSSVLKNNGLNAKDINDTSSGSSFDNGMSRAKLYELLKEREECWWKSRQHLIALREKQMFWYGENSLMMWLMWQLVSYIGVAMALMLLSKLLGISLPLWQYVGLFVIQTVVFVVMIVSKGRLANNLQSRIDTDQVQSEEALNEMAILAEDCLYLDVHDKSPISLKQLYNGLEGQFHLASLHYLLQKEVSTGRLILTQKQVDAEVLPPQLADNELKEYAHEMIYKSTL